MLVIVFSDDLQDAVFVLVLSCFVLVLTKDLPFTNVNTTMCFSFNLDERQFNYIELKLSKTRFNFKGGALS